MKFKDRREGNRCQRCLGLLWPVLFGLAPAVQARTELACRFEFNGETESHVFQSVTDPYRARSVDLARRFRFKAVLVEEGAVPARVDLYVSYHGDRQAMILQHAHYARPDVPAVWQPEGLTGRQAVYSPWLGKELAYGCGLREVQP